MTLPRDEWPRVKAVFDAALALDGADRLAFVANACGGDAALRHQVETLLASHDRAATFLETPAIEVARAGARDEPVGRAAGPYRILSKIGEGGMGAVYLAHDDRLDRRVALKLLSPECAVDAERLRRFRQEAKAASSLNHPHIVVIHDFGELDGRPFIVTEFIEGETLRQRLQRGALTVTDVIDIASQVASALAAAHARGIVHRDVKPENVMVRPDGYVKVLDFGLAKLAADAAGDQADLAVRTKPGMVMGTPRYMSPEQARGRDVDARSDVWSFGVLLYEMVAGRPPFAGATAADLIAAVLQTEPVPLELQAPHVPAALARIVARTLRKDPTARYAAGGELASDLAALKKQRDADEPASPAVANGVGGESEISSTPHSRVAKRTRLIVIPFRLLRPDSDIDFLSFALADAIATTLSSVDSLIVRSSMTAARFATDQLDLKALVNEVEVDAVVTGTLMRMGPQLRVTAQLLSVPQGTIVWSERIDVPADDLIRIQDGLSDRIVDSLALPLTTREQQSLRRDVPATARAYELYLRGNSFFYHPNDWPIARDLFVECVKEDPQYAPAWARLGRCYRLTAKFKSSTVAEAKDNLGRASVAFRKAFELNPDLPAAHHLYTTLETDLGRAEEAMLRLVRRTRQRRADPELYAGLVHACRYCGLLDASIAAYERAKQLDPQIATSAALTYWMRGEYERSLQGFSWALGFYVGLPLVSLGRNEEAIAVTRAAAVADPTTRSYQSILPLLLEGRTGECRRVLDDLQPRNPDPESVFLGARTYASLGALDAAAQQFARAVDMGFFCYPTFVRDPWLDPLRSHATFAEALARANLRHGEAARKFRDAGGERLLGMG